MKKRINVVGAVLTQGTKILAAQRGEGMSLSGMWEFPGGKIEEGETPQEALRRELEEELLCSAEIGEKVESTEYEYDFGIVILTTFFGTIVDKEPTLTEHSEVRWVEASDLGGLPWAPADIPAVNRVVAHFAA
ncbi:MAG: (deoxy)nucleoside triphosphate pyrophosphohydrolase [Corynebacterium sp.]|uniref:(deoxy)nucleoside triphosphate pyrophosphohydrolase n=1 Tax=Corynebacterium TaxID=1716 RepID=UPI0026476201|nr:(deoxy)nucleoside triphosphate pyrophosphohydrolase [Corynebacterium sp.]MDN5721898.1 (deoxy)nucleoside triphosphate pyrophosphohydrolase [Corynebacterium sp.]MDN6281865.1 (deoxy)nucleoside triphosphate pyrophosphohydrolase [Corynebacterium sp.]MDN6305077.1 (deoxy)nucleoside triphosphate pyrophosphohydrolase [Corynebacterium sp.]MDN6351723.1 (deoxy)nucleoside triphosphate pyrophosphohydrolase [Corynebacterium sp.]MDN6367253.1 (deoxy)nucleoside triphosphate pyrophosphohydrolase [Corynebacter